MTTANAMPRFKPVSWNDGWFIHDTETGLYRPIPGGDVARQLELMVQAAMQIDNPQVAAEFSKFWFHHPKDFQRKDK